jgi:hypothetical protein
MRRELSAVCLPPLEHAISMLSAWSVVIWGNRNSLKQFFSAQWGSAPTSSVAGHARRMTGYFFLGSKSSVMERALLSPSVRVIPLGFA